VRQPILVYGSGILGRLSRDMVEASTKARFAGYIDDLREGPEIVGGLDKVASDRHLSRAFVCPAIGYADMALRWRIIEGVRSHRLKLATLRHPGDYLGRDAKLGEGGIFLPGSHIDRECSLGVGVVLWPGATINHHCAIGDNVFVCSGATICGCAAIGPHSFIGAGATVVDEAKIGSHCFVGAGVLVHGDLPDGSRIVARPNYLRA
jgi:sugar O-acyltransferase (sialic acid O-acetyltransferase NeuD family)